MSNMVGVVFTHYAWYMQFVNSNMLYFVSQVYDIVGIKKYCTKLLYIRDGNIINTQRSQDEAKLMVKYTTIASN